MEELMIDLSIQIVDEEGNILAESKNTEDVYLVYKDSYKEGDKIIFKTNGKNQYYIAQVDDALGEAFVYITEEEIIYPIPFNEKRTNYSPKVFNGDIHLAHLRVAYEEEVNAYKNLAKNVVDKNGLSGIYPHAKANVETRGEAVFAARNAIDGVCENRSHGAWPYESWGINMQDDAEIKIDFGREVAVDKVVLYTRSDFPHDNWWEEVTIEFSDGSELVWKLEKSYKPHKLKFEEKKIRSLVIKNLIKADDPSPFPALTQVEVYGVEA
jgi:hypothetical protein